MSGKVYLVGAGPGDPELLTLKAARIIASAEVIVFDRLVSHEILSLAPPTARSIDVGKAARRHPVPQGEINARLVSLARAGHDVVRLKGGDPLLFGRGGEEALALAKAGITFEVVPGITSAQGTAAALRLPLTHREIASSVRFITGHFREDAPLDLDWHGLADPTTTLVVYMGLASIGGIARQLIAHGRGPSTPVLAVSRATQPDQRKLGATLASVARAVAAARFESPTIFVIGEVVELAMQLAVRTVHQEERCLAEAR
jgi:uroporphyrin-III C-methyltransferase